MQKRINIIIKVLNSGGVVVMPADTIYGIFARAIDKQAVEKIYKVRKRKPSKPMIITISSVNQLKEFNIKLSKEQERIIDQLWPGKVSIVFPCSSSKFAYLHRNKKSLAFRLPKNKMLINIINKTGPLVAPSANIEGQPHAKNIKQAKKYFGKSVDDYFSKGTIKSTASTIVKFENNKIKILRQGVKKI